MDNFVPYALEAIRRHPRGAMSERDVRDVINEQFGLTFPASVVASLLNRALKRKLLVREIEHSLRLYTLADGVAATLPDISAQQESGMRQQNYLVSRLVDFANERFAVNWNAEMAGEALVAYVDEHAAPMLVSNFKRPGAGEHEGDQGRGYVVNAFVAEIDHSDPTAFSYLDEMVKGSMLSAALYLPIPGDVQRKFKQTTLYLDTPVCLRLLGHEGEDAKQAVSQIVSLAVSQGAKLACFTHTVKEMRGILDGARQILRRSPGSESAIRGVAAHFRKEGFDEGDATLAMERLERDLEHARVAVRDPPDHIAAYEIDESAFEVLLNERVGYKYQSTLLPDLNSVAAIHRLRGGASGPYLETCRAVLVTDNSALASAARQFFDSGKHEWPLVVLDHTLAALVWVKQPGLAPELSRQQIIADCYAALSPSAALWASVSIEINSLSTRSGISPEDVALLRYSNEAERAVMDVTLGDPKRVSEAAIREALEIARSAAAEPAIENARVALGRAEQAESSEASGRFREEEANARASDTEKRLEEIEAREARRRNGILNSADRSAHRIERVLWTCVVVVAAGSLVTALATLVPRFDQVVPGWLVVGSRLCSVVVVMLSLIALVFGGHVKAWISTFRSRVNQRVASRALKRAWFDE